MSLLDEIENAKQQLLQQIESYKTHQEDVEKGRLPVSKLGEGSITFEAMSFIRRYATSYHLQSLAKLALKDDSLFLEQPKREELEEMVSVLDEDIKNMEEHHCQRIYKAYESLW